MTIREILNQVIGMLRSYIDLNRCFQEECMIIQPGKVVIGKNKKEEFDEEDEKKAKIEKYLKVLKKSN
jgi:hypothetical protein